jgi:hypothetical protein
VFDAAETWILDLGTNSRNRFTRVALANTRRLASNWLRPQIVLEEADQVRDPEAAAAAAEAGAGVVSGTCDTGASAGAATFSADSLWATR